MHNYKLLWLIVHILSNIYSAMNSSQRLYMLDTGVLNGHCIQLEVLPDDGPVGAGISMYIYCVHLWVWIVKIRLPRSKLGWMFTVLTICGGTVLQSGRSQVQFNFHWHNTSGHTTALKLTQPPTEMNTRIIFWGVKAAGAWGWQPNLTTFRYCCFEIWKPHPPETTRTCPGLY